jgi:hypothetical protein
MISRLQIRKVGGRSIAAALAITGAFVAGLASAQEGDVVEQGAGAKPPAAGATTVRVWKPARRNAMGKQPIVDLRYLGKIPLLMPPKSQGYTNSCSAWAVTALKTYQEAVDQKWIPNAPSRQFSPLFVWTQLNQGKNDGVALPDALTLLRKKGAATLQTMPWLDWDVSAKPSEQALSEAAQYRIRGFRQIESAEAIKAALRRRRPVVIAAMLDPILFSCRFKGTFTLPLRRRGMKRLAELKKQGDAQAHAYHAMLIVGYNDRRKAFLIRNSWGSDWCQGGYVWVSYDLFRKIEYSDDPVEWLLGEAYIAFDDPRRVGSDAQREEVVVRGAPWFLGGSGAERQWGWKFSLVGYGDVLKGIQRVVWKLPPEAGGAEIVRDASAASESFQVAGTIQKTGAFPLKAAVTFGSGKTQKLAYTFRVEEATYGSLRLRATDSYYGVDDGRPQWVANVELTGNLAHRAEVKSVTYTFPEGYPDRTDSPPAGDEMRFPTALYVEKPVTLKAILALRDGSQRDLTLDIRPKAARRDELYVKATVLQKRFWNLTLGGPGKVIKNIESVQYSYRTAERDKWKTRSPQPDFATPDLQFPINVFSPRTLEVKATVRIKGGQEQKVAARRLKVR